MRRRATARTCVALATVLLSVSFRPAAAQLGAGVASKVVEGCAAHARGKGQSHAIAVYDEGGHAVALLRMDGNAPGIMAFAMQKAEAVAHWRFSTAEMAAAARETPGFASAPHVVIVPGDVACAEAGVRAAGLLSVRRRPG